MIEDEVLKWKFKAGSQEALRRIYEKYLNRLLTLAMALLNDAAAAEDVVHDVFVSFAESAENFRLTGSLKSYLTTCVVNRARDRIRAKQRGPMRMDGTESIVSDKDGPDRAILCSERAQQLNRAVAQLPDEQRQTIVLHLKGEMTFREIAKLQNVSINTIQGRYRYGLDKVRSVLSGEVEK
ncbi:MAG: sigma-70 family RNA polymerase sigma factor [Phycisphaerales bacterium]|nr:MAG: sigma-70 family RNA polymerase sigma factor [Phycisphaerales bacterium]